MPHGPDTHVDEVAAAEENCRPTEDTLKIS